VWIVYLGAGFMHSIGRQGAVQMNEKSIPIDAIRDLLDRVRHGSKRVNAVASAFSLKVYQVNSSPKYAYPSIRVDIQDLEPADYS